MRAAAEPSARCSASAASSAAWRLAGVSPPSSARDRLGADQGRVQQGRAAQQRDDRTAGRDRGAAAAGVEAGVEDAPVGAVGVERERDADQIAARRPARGAGVRAGGGVPARERSFEVLDQARGECHTVECKDCSGLAGGAGGADRGRAIRAVRGVRPGVAPNAIPWCGGRQRGRRQEWRDSETACWIAKASARPVSTVVWPCGLTISRVGVWVIWTAWVIVPNCPTWPAEA